LISPSITTGAAIISTGDHAWQILARRLGRAAELWIAQLKARLGAKKRESDD
jgi:hypothetical protein